MAFRLLPSFQDGNTETGALAQLWAATRRPADKISKVESSRSNWKRGTKFSLLEANNRRLQAAGIARSDLSKPRLKRIKLSPAPAKSQQDHPEIKAR
jgi:hypothetical protein